MTMFFIPGPHAFCPNCKEITSGLVTKSDLGEIELRHNEAIGAQVHHVLELIEMTGRDGDISKMQEKVGADNWRLGLRAI